MPENMHYEEEILLNVRKIMRAIDTYSSKLAKNYGLTTPQLICLKKLLSEGEMTPSLLAKSVSLSHATVTGIVNRLEKKDLIERKRSTNDGRSFIISVTESGKAMALSSPSMLQDHFMKELSKLADWEKTQILSSLQRVSHILDAESIEAAPVLTTGPVEAPVEIVSEFLNANNGTSGKTNEKSKADPVK